LEYNSNKTQEILSIFGNSVLQKLITKTMKILVIDDQKLVLIPLAHKLEEMGYEVRKTTNGIEGIELFETIKPNLVIVDINMPTISGLEIVKYIRNSRKPETPIIILSGSTDDEVLFSSFELGVNDYMRKPLSLNEVGLRIKKIIGFSPLHSSKTKYSNTILKQRCVGIVIPCYNEEKRLNSKDFTDYIDRNAGYHLCFVNDGSTDKTLAILKSLSISREDFITVYECAENVGKAEAVRRGMLHMAKRNDLDYIGFLDADLSTSLSDFDDLVAAIENSKYKIVSGSRMSRMGADIDKEPARELISLAINFIIRRILKMNFNDTQCGAKVFHKDVVLICFDKKFISKWIFDVEIYRRITLYFGILKARKLVCEQPLKRWVHANGSKLSMKDSIKIIGQLLQIFWHYRAGKNKNKKVRVNKREIHINFKKTI
jgi:CheY-like chemotaxis protein